MSFNKSLFKKMVEESKQKKTQPKPKDRIVDPMGQWAHPGQVTRIPSNRITMQGVPYPVLGVGNTGQQQMMFPGQEYAFPGSQYVDEFPLMQAQNGLEQKINKSLGNPMGRAARFSEEIQPGEDFDSARHYMAAALTNKAIQDKTGNIPIASNILGWLGSNISGIGHELSTLYSGRKEDTRPWSTKIRESFEDVVNNAVGATAGSIYNNPKQIENLFFKLSEKNLLPDGIEDPKGLNLYLKKTKADKGKFGKYRNGGDISIPNLEEGNWLNRYNKGGSTTSVTTKPPVYKNNTRDKKIYSNIPIVQNEDYKMLLAFGYKPEEAKKTVQKQIGDYNKWALKKYGKVPVGYYMNKFDDKEGQHLPIFRENEVKELPELKMVRDRIDIKPFNFKTPSITKQPNIQPNQSGDYVLRFSEWDNKNKKYNPQERYFKTRKEADDAMQYLSDENDRMYSSGAFGSRRYYDNLSTQGNYQNGGPIVVPYSKEYTDKEYQDYIKFYEDFNRPPYLRKDDGFDKYYHEKIKNLPGMPIYSSGWERKNIADDYVQHYDTQPKPKAGFVDRKMENEIIGYDPNYKDPSQTEGLYKMIKAFANHKQSNILGLRNDGQLPKFQGDKGSSQVPAYLKGPMKGDSQMRGNENLSREVSLQNTKRPLSELEHRKMVYNTIRPSDYFDTNNYARYLFNNQREEFDDERSEEAFRIYLGLEDKPKYFRPSIYRPTINRSYDNGMYYSVDPELENDIFESFKDKVKLNEILPTSENYVKSYFDESDPSVWKENGNFYRELVPGDKNLLFGRPMVSNARALGKFVVSRGKDKKGEYLSYADQYDFPDWMQNKMKGKPYKIYGRIYYPNKKEKGGEILKADNGFNVTTETTKPTNIDVLKLLGPFMLQQLNPVTIAENQQKNPPSLAVQLLDPSGVSNYGNVKTSYENMMRGGKSYWDNFLNALNFEFELAGSLPIVGTVPKLIKAGTKTKKTTKAITKPNIIKETLFRPITNIDKFTGANKLIPLPVTTSKGLRNAANISNTFNRGRRYWTGALAGVNYGLDAFSNLGSGVQPGVGPVQPGYTTDKGQIKKIEDDSLYLDRSRGDQIVTMKLPDGKVVKMSTGSKAYDDFIKRIDDTSYDYDDKSGMYIIKKYK